jgi:hypothetical protein
MVRAFFFFLILYDSGRSSDWFFNRDGVAHEFLLQLGVALAPRLLSLEAQERRNNGRMIAGNVRTRGNVLTDLAKVVLVRFHSFGLFVGHADDALNSLCEAKAKKYE